MPQVDPILLTTTIVRRFSKEDEKGYATGFFFSDTNNNVYLVTNKHVIYGEKYSEENAEPEIDRLRLLLHTDVSDLSRNKEVVVQLLEGSNRRWKEHSEKDIDIVCIPIVLDRKEFAFATVGENLLDSSNLRIGFETIFVMGYPYGWYDTLNNLPITRIGHLSSPFGVPFRGNPFVLGDVETHSGMSGGPVFMHLRDYVMVGNEGLTRHLGASKIILVGVFSGQPRWEYKDKKTGKTIKIPHSLSIIWFGGLIKDIITS